MKTFSVSTISQTRVPQKFVPKNMHSNVLRLLNKMLREEATHIEKRGEYHSTVISSVSIGDTIEFCTNRIATPKKISKGNLAKGISTIKLNNTQFDMDNSTGEILTSPSTPLEHCKDLLEKCNNALKNIIANFNSKEVSKQEVGLRGLIG